MNINQEFRPRIYKYSFGHIDRGILKCKIEGPKLLDILDIQEQGSGLMLWAEVDIAKKERVCTVEIYSAWTGDPPPGEGWMYVKTIQSQYDGLVYHLYINNSCKETVKETII